MDYLILVPFSYLMGSIPFGVLVGWVMKRVDIREHGSGNIGMTNVMRLAGVPAGIVVLALDMGKAALAVILAMWLGSSSGVTTICALFVLAGHIWPIFIGFKGGRGTASGWAVLFVLSPISGVVATVVALPMILITKYVSVGSIVGATVGGLTIAVLALSGHTEMHYAWFGFLGTSLILLRHTENMKRLIKGEERKLGNREA